MSSWFKKQLRETTEALKKGVIKVRNQTLMEALIAGFVMVAHANGAIKPEEKDKLMGFIRHSELLSAFDQSEILKYIDKYVQHYAFDPAIAEANALNVISKLNSKESEARLMVRVCIAIGAADEDFDPAERAVVRKICDVLKLNPKDFGLEPEQHPPAAPAPTPSSATVPAAPSAESRRPSGQSLNRGERVSLKQRDPHLQRLQVGLGWNKSIDAGAAMELDTSAFMLKADGKVRSDADFIFYNQRRSPCGSVEHQGASESDAAVIGIDLTRIPNEIQRIVFTVTIHEAEQRRQNFAQVRDAFIRLANAETGAEVIRYELHEDATDETAMIFGELYRHSGEWRFTAVGQGYIGGLAALCSRFGINL